MQQRNRVTLAAQQDTCTLETTSPLTVPVADDESIDPFAALFAEARANGGSQDVVLQASRGTESSAGQEGDLLLMSFEGL